MAKDVAIVLNSGSLNSAVVTALAAQRYRPVLLHASMSEPRQSEPEDGAASQGRAAFDQQVAHFKPYREHVLNLSFLTELNAGGGRAHAGAFRSNPSGRSGGAGLDLLPLMAAAARFAAQYHASATYLGLRVGGGVDELAQATEYVQIWTDLLQLGCGLSDMEFQAPLLELEPWQVVDLGFQVSAPLERTWSCDADDSPEPCWACRGCREREAAFQRAAKPDPIRTARKR